MTPHEEAIRALLEYKARWPEAPDPTPEMYDLPRVGIALLRRALERGRPLTESEIIAAFPGAWRPDSDMLI